MNQDIYALVGKYGFKSLHSRLTEIMKWEYEYLKGQFPLEKPLMNEVIKAPLVTESDVQSEVKKPTEKRKYTKKNQVQPQAPIQQEVTVAVSEVPEIKDILVVAPAPSGYRDPKEVKAFQKAGEEERHKLNEAAGLQLSQILTKDNLKQWIEAEGHTYAWVAREKAGCPDTQVAATAKMMGIKSTFSKRKAIMLNRG
jgi:2-succinyl-5-enolpyruvyl-6-hydroxy-3-cyclohexene-1-carboxylate synthase